MNESVLQSIAGSVGGMGAMVSEGEVDLDLDLLLPLLLLSFALSR